MAQWKETLEPYVKVQERIKTATLNPTAGEDLIIGVVVISDAGPSTPTLVTSQTEFKQLFASEALTEDYMNDLGKLYDEDPTVVPTMWSNAYRLAGSNTLLVVRAGKTDSINAIQPLDKDSKGEYIIRDGQVLKKVPGGFKLSLDKVFSEQNGWGINLAEVGKIGCFVTDEGPDYDYFVNTLPDLVKKLNESPNFYSPNYVFQQCEITKEGTQVSGLIITKDKLDSSDPNIDTVYFKEVYLGEEFLSDEESTTYLKGLANLIPTKGDGDEPAGDSGQQVISDLSNLVQFTEEINYYAVNTYNSASDIRIRIRRFNHDAVVSRDIDSISMLTANSASPYTVLESVLDHVNTDRDFYEIAIQDNTVSDTVGYYNVGNLPGRGDITVDEINSLTTMVDFVLPVDLSELGLGYFGKPYFVVEDYDTVEEFKNSHENVTVVEKNVSGSNTSFNNESEIDNPEVGKYYAIADRVYLYTDKAEQIYKTIGLSRDTSSLLKVTMDDIKNSLDLLANDEIYVVEGLSDLGFTDPTFQNALSTLAINENYFYPISTVNSTNYMVLANKFKAISFDSCKLFGLAPWDIDTATLGWKYYASPSVLYWETVARNRRNNQEFRSTFGQVGGIIQYQRPTTEFNKKTRQLLLTKKINTVLWNNTTQAWNINDNYTKQSEDNILSDEANSRLFIRISKAQPVLLKQFIGRRITQKLCDEIADTIRYWFHNTILTMEYNIDDFKVFCEYDEALARKNKVKVVINVRFLRALKYIEVYNNAFDVGMSIEGME